MDLTAENFPNLGSFLADHFGGYSDAESAAKDCGYTSFTEYLEVFVWGVGEAQDLEAAERWLAQQRIAGDEPWQKMRDQFFDDAGNVLPEATEVPKALRLIVEQNS